MNINTKDGLTVDEITYSAFDPEILRYEWRTTNDQGHSYEESWRIRYTGNQLYALVWNKAKIELIIAPFGTLYTRMYNAYSSVAYTLNRTTSRGEYWLCRGDRNEASPYDQRYLTKPINDRMVSREELWNTWKTFFELRGISNPCQESQIITLYNGNPFSPETTLWSAYNKSVGMRDWYVQPLI